MPDASQINRSSAGSDNNTSPKKTNTVGPKGISDDKRIDETTEDSFPASDPPSHTGIIGPGGNAPSK